MNLNDLTELIGASPKGMDYKDLAKLIYKKIAAIYDVEVGDTIVLANGKKGIVTDMPLLEYISGTVAGEPLTWKMDGFVSNPHIYVDPDQLRIVCVKKRKLQLQVGMSIMYGGEPYTIVKIEGPRYVCGDKTFDENLNPIEDTRYEKLKEAAKEYLRIIELEGGLRYYLARQALKDAL